MTTTLDSQAILAACENDLQKAVVEWVCGKLDDYDGQADKVFADLFHGGCESGIVGNLVYYTDTAAFYVKHREAIWELLAEQADDVGQSVLSLVIARQSDIDDPDVFENTMAWMAFESAARQLADKLGIDV